MKTSGGGFPRPLVIYYDQDGRVIDNFRIERSGLQS